MWIVGSAEERKSVESSRISIGEGGEWWVRELERERQKRERTERD